MENNTTSFSTAELFELAFKNSSEAMLVLDVNQKKIIEINQAALDIFNIKNDIKNLKKIFKIINKEPLKGTIEIAEKTILNYEKKNLEKDSNKIQLVFLKNKTVLKAIKKQDNYKDLFDNTFELLYIMDENFTFIDVNKTVVEKYGYTKEEIIGKTPALFDAPGLNDMKKVGIKLELAKNGENQYLLWWSIKKNGDIFLKDLNFRTSNYQGKKVIIASGRDISEKYNYEKNLAEKEKRYRQLFERNLAAVFRSSYDGKLLECNDAFIKIFGYQSDKEIKKDIVNVINCYARKEDRFDLLIELETKHYIKGRKIKFIGKNREEITVLMNVSFIYDEDHKVNYLEGSFLDITELDKAQNLLNRSEKNYRELLDGLSFGILILNKDRILYTNKKTQNLLHYKKKELQNLSIEKLLLEKQKETFLSNLLKINKEEDVSSMEFKLIGNDKTSLDVEMKFTSVEFDSKKCVFISFLDIGDRKKAIQEKAKTKSLEAVLKYKEISHKRLIDAQSYTEGIIESSLDMIFTCDLKNQINKLNSAALNEFGVNNSDVLNKNISYFFFNKNQIKVVLEELEKQKKYTGEVQFKRSNGSIFPAYLSLSYLYNSDKEILGIMGVSRDITEIRRKEIEYKRQALKLNSIIESSSHFFITINSSYIITSYNHVFKNEIHKNMGGDVEIGINFFDLYSHTFGLDHESNIKFLEKKIKESFKGKTVSFELKTKNPDGNFYYREVYLNPIYNDSGKIIEISGMGHDITDKKLSEERLKASLNEKEVLLKEVHHRVKNNMQVISSILSLQSNCYKDKQTLEVLHESQNRIKSMALIHERLYQNKDFSSINFKSYIEDLTENLVYSYEINKPSIGLTFNLDEVYLKLNTAIPCGLILNELISNSLKYAFPLGRKGIINIDLKKDKERIYLKIEDNGIGLSENINFRKTKSLGLQLVTTLVNQLEGKITLNSKKGTSFTIAFDKTNIK